MCHCAQHIEHKSCLVNSRETNEVCPHFGIITRNSSREERLAKSIQNSELGALVVLNYQRDYCLTFSIDIDTQMRVHKLHLSRKKIYFAFNEHWQSHRLSSTKS